MARVLASFGVVCDHSNFTSQPVRRYYLDLLSFTKMSRNTTSVNLSDSYAILLDESLKENQALRQQLKERDEENDSKLRDLTNKVDSLCQLLAEKNSGTNDEKSKKKNCKVHVPTRCRVRSLLIVSDACFSSSSSPLFTLSHVSLLED